MSGHDLLQHGCVAEVHVVGADSHTTIGTRPALATRQASDSIDLWHVIVCIIYIGVVLVAVRLL